MVERKGPYEGMNVVSPHPRIFLSPGRLVREPVAAQIQGHEPESVRQVGIQLTIPGHDALRKAVDEHDRSPVWAAGLDRMQLNVAAAWKLVVLQHVGIPHAELGVADSNANR